VFAAAARHAPVDLSARSRLAERVDRALSTDADRWVARRLLAGRLGTSPGLPDAGIDPAPIRLRYFPGRTDRRVLVVAGVHGSEHQGIEIARRLVDQLVRRRREGRHPAAGVLVVPVLFPDNARHGPTGRREGDVPTNRNFPAAGRPLSDAATGPDGTPLDALGRPIHRANRLLVRLLERYRPRHVISIHGTKAPHRAGVFSDPYRAGGVRTGDRIHPLTGSSAPTVEAESVPEPVSRAAATRDSGLPSHRSLEAARRRTRADQRLALAAARSIARQTDGFERLRAGRQQAEARRAAAAGHWPEPRVARHPAVAGNRLGGRPSAHWSGEVAGGVSLGRYAPARGIGVFTVEPAINRASGDYPVSLDPGVPAAVRREELEAYARALRTVILDRDPTNSHPASRSPDRRSTGPPPNRPSS
jgi:hypothetical protein